MVNMKMVKKLVIGLHCGEKINLTDLNRCIIRIVNYFIKKKIRRGGG